MSSNPTNIALLGHRWGAYLRNHSETYEIWCSRVQSVTPSLNAPTTKFFELGNLSPVGVVTQPVEFRVAMEENLHNSAIDSIIANGSGSPVSNFTAGDMVNSTAMRLCVVGRDIGGTNPSLEYVLGSLVVAEINYRFQIGGPCTVSYTLEGKSGALYTTGSLVHTTWGVSDAVAPGAINGKDARVYFGSGLTVPASSQGYRLQSFNIRLAFPVQTVRELGNRALVGKLADVPDITCDFDLLSADKQPHDVWMGLTGDSTGYDLANPNTTNVFIKVFDPALAEATEPPIKAFRIENCKPVTSDIVRAQVRALATNRYSLTSTSATTANSAGLIIFTNAAPT
jgi:hypothetical protein